MTRKFPRPRLLRLSLEMDKRLVKFCKTTKQEVTTFIRSAITEKIDKEGK